ncbi:mitotic-spindle organizing gamma-tubulin ring associated-domain-containing protein, partial [Mucidula mucida]
VLHEISQLLNTRLDRETLTTCVRMIEGGVNPEALAAVIQELRRENSALKQESRPASSH